MGNGQRSERGMRCRRPRLLKHSRGVFGESIADCMGCTGRLRAELGRNNGWPDLHPGPVQSPSGEGTAPGTSVSGHPLPPSLGPQFLCWER